MNNVVIVADRVVEGSVEKLAPAASNETRPLAAWANLNCTLAPGAVAGVGNWIVPKRRVFRAVTT